MKIRFWLALWAGKITNTILKIIGKKGTTLPGFIALKICPEVIGLLTTSFAEGTVIITGTNGKTTTNNLLASILKTAGKKVAFNREGANMLNGIAGALLQNTSFSGKAQADLLLLEVDEATIPAVCAQVVPKIAIITNFFRDQLDRYGELDTTIRLVKESLPESTELILNADDPLVAQIGRLREGVFYYGACCLPSSRSESTETREGKFCTACGQELQYELFHYGQLGIYHCPGCGFKRPEPYLEACDIKQEEKWLSFRIDETYHVPLLGYYNLYNALASFCAADRLGVGREDIRSGLSNFVSDAGRMEQFTLPNSRLTLTLIKNPTGFNQVIQTICELDKPLRLLVAINDLAADGRDISWLWDTDLELLASKQDQVRQLVCSGLRAEDMALRLKYAGFPEEKLVIEHSLEKAVDYISNHQAANDEAVFILSTYTVLFSIRDILVIKKVEDSQKRVGDL